MEIRSRLKSLKTELAKMGVKNAQVASYPALLRSKIEALEKKHKHRLPDALRAYYLETNGQNISWSLPDTGVAAHSLVLDVKAFFTGRISACHNGKIQTDVPFYSKYLEAEQQRALDAYWVFEKLYVDSFVLIPKQSAPEEVSLYLLEYPCKLTRLDLSFSDYIDGIFANKGLLGWQEQHKDRDRDEALIASFARSVELVNRPPSQGRPVASAYQKRLDDLVKRLKSDKEVTLVQVDRYPLPPLNAFRKIEATFQSKLPQAMVDFYSEVNGFKLIWRTKPGVEPAKSGVIDIPPLEKAFGGEHYLLTIDWDEFVTYKTLWDDELKEAAPQDYLALKSKRVFDRHLGRNQLLMEVTKGGVEFFSYVDGGVSRLDATFDDVINTVFQTGGIEYYPEQLAPGARE